MIKAVIFDFGGVVFRNREDYEGPRGMLQSDPVLWQKARVGEIEDELVFQNVAKNYSVDTETVKKWLLSRREPNQEVLDLVIKIKPEIKRVVINNGLKILFRSFVDKYQLEEKFDILVNSGEEKVEKPDRKIYLRTCQRLGVKPEECIFVDDNEKLIEGADEVGMKTFLFNNVLDMKRKFRELNLF